MTPFPIWLVEHALWSLYSQILATINVEFPRAFEELWSLTSFAHGQFNLVTTTFFFIEFTFCHNDWSLLIVLYWLLFSTSILPSSYWRISIRLFLFADRLLKYCSTADAVYSEEHILELIGVLSFGVGKFNIALILEYNGFRAYLLTFHRRCQLTAQH